jgi:hypothetical protein
MAKVEDDDVRVPQAPSDIFEVCKAVIETSQQPKSSVHSACKRHKIDYYTFVEHCGKYEDLYQMARKAGIKPQKAHHQIKHRDPDAVDSSIPADMAMSVRNKKNITPAIEEFIPSKEQALSLILEMLGKGASFRAAVARSGARELDVRRWVLETPDLIRVFKKAEGCWTEKFYDHLNKAIQVAAEKGNVKDLMEIASRRFPEWQEMEKLSQEAARLVKTNESIEVQSGAEEQQTETKQSCAAGAGISIIVEGEVVEDGNQ